MEYLAALVYQLHGRSGVGMNGLAPLSYGTIADYVRLTGTPISGDDVRALMRLDAALLYPDAQDTQDDEADRPASPQKSLAWPTRKSTAAAGGAG